MFVEIKKKVNERTRCLASSNVHQNLQSSGNCAVKINGNKCNELSKHANTDVAIDGQTACNSGCSLCSFPSWVWRIVNVNKWSDYLLCPTVMIITIAWLYIDQHYQRGREKWDADDEFVQYKLYTCKENKRAVNVNEWKNRKRFDVATSK